MNKKLSCSICRKRFRTTNGLMWHLKNIHGSDAARSGMKTPPSTTTIQHDGLSSGASEFEIINRDRARPLWCVGCSKVSRHYFDRNDDLQCEDCGRTWSR